MHSICCGTGYKPEDYKLQPHLTPTHKLLVIANGSGENVDSHYV